MTDTVNEVTETKKQFRVKPSLWSALFLYAGYLAIFYTVWAVNGVDYPTLGNSVESTMLHYAAPTLSGVVFLLIAITAMGWWRPVLFDKKKAGPKWLWTLPAAVVVFGLISLSSVNPALVTPELLLWSILGAIGVGVGEEIITRGGLLTGLRADGLTEGKVWLYTTLFFSALHLPNILFGAGVGDTIVQLFLTFVMGSGLYAMRRMSGTLLLPIVFHGFWDSSVFLPRATEGQATTLALLIYPLAIAVIIVLMKREWNKKITIE